MQPFSRGTPGQPIGWAAVVQRNSLKFADASRGFKQNDAMRSRRLPKSGGADIARSLRARVRGPRKTPSPTRHPWPQGYLVRDLWHGRVGATLSRCTCLDVRPDEATPADLNVHRSRIASPLRSSYSASRYVPHSPAWMLMTRRVPVKGPNSPDLHCATSLSVATRGIGCDSALTLATGAVVRTRNGGAHWELPRKRLFSRFGYGPTAMLIAVRARITGRSQRQRHPIARGKRRRGTRRIARVSRSRDAACDCCTTVPGEAEGPLVARPRSGVDPHPEVRQASSPSGQPRCTCSRATG